ncbi:MAG: hypothetical protein ACPL7K_05135, partial [Armatimonadota bacterium]
TNVYSAAGISGIQADTVGFLAGVFLDDSEPMDPPPPILNFRGNSDFLYLSPELRQTFFIGDGQTSNDIVQTFFVPVGATRLFLGFADSYDRETHSITGPPRFYNDNGGYFEVTYSIHTVAEPPVASMLIALAVSVCAICGRRHLVCTSLTSL